MRVHLRIPESPGSLLLLLVSVASARPALPPVLSDSEAAALSERVRTLPPGPEACAAYTRIGDFAVDRKKPYDAIAAYQHALVCPDGRAYATAQLAWSYSEVGALDQAITQMQSVVAAARQKGDHAVGDDALADLSLFYAASGDVEAAERYFDGVGRHDLFRQSLMTVGSTCERLGKLDLAITTWRMLVADAPNSPDAVGFTQKSVTDRLVLGHVADAAAELDRMVDLYGAGSEWARANKDDPKVLALAESAIEADLRLVLQSMGKPGAPRDAPRRAAAERLYARYFKLFDASPHAVDVHQSHADMLFEAPGPAAAWGEYEEVLKRDPTRRDAALGAFRAADAVFGTGRSVDSWSDRAVIAGERFAAAWPDDPETTGILYVTGNRLIDANRLAHAGEVVRDAIHRDPRSSQAVPAASRLLAALATAKAWSDVEATCIALQPEHLGTPGFRFQLWRLRGHAHHLTRRGESVALPSDP